LIYALNNYQI